MWFLFGVLTILGLVLILAQARGPAPWVGETARLEGGEPYVFQEREHKGKPTGLSIGVSCPPGFQLTLQPERQVDRFFKRLGVSKEFTTRDPEFDDRVYIVAEDSRVGGLLYRNASVRRRLLDLFALDHLGLTLRAVHCDDARLWVEYLGATARPTALIAREVVPSLLELSRALGAERGTPAPGLDQFVWKAAVLGSVAAALALNGFIQWYRADFFVLPSILDERRWMGTSLVAAALLLYALVMTALVWMKRSARTHLVIMEVGLFGVFGCFGTAASAVRDLNHTLDTSAPQTVDAEVVAKHGRARRSFSASVSVKDWEQEGRWVRVRVPSEVHDSLPDGWLQNAWLRLQVRRGALRIRYVESVSPVAPPE